MRPRRSELIWAAWGFAGGFVLCYLLVAGFSNPNVATRTTAKSISSAPQAPSKLWPVYVTNTVFVTNNVPGPIEVKLLFRIDEGMIQKGQTWVAPVRRPGYSLDLIDTR